jgi:hypothetical protein
VEIAFEAATPLGIRARNREFGEEFIERTRRGCPIYFL